MEMLDGTCVCCKEKDTYIVRGKCGNCASEFRLVLTKGHEKPGAFSGKHCPTCGCYSVAGYELVTK